MKKYAGIISIVVVICLILGARWGVKQWKLYNNPYFSVLDKVYGDDCSWSRWTVGFGGNSVFGYSAKYDDYMRQLIGMRKEMEGIIMETSGGNLKQVDVKTKMVIDNDKTIVYYKGQITTPEGDVVEIDKEYILDFVIPEVHHGT